MPAPLIGWGIKLIGGKIVRKVAGNAAKKYGVDKMAGDFLRSRGKHKTAKIADAASRVALGKATKPKKK